jgi:hypothetical protein
MTAYDAILGFDWLQTHSPMQCNWATKTLEFTCNGVLVQLQGIQPSGPKLQEASITNIHKWATCNDI